MIGRAPDSGRVDMGDAQPGPAQLPDRLRGELGRLAYSGLVVGPDHPYLFDCWVAVIGPTPVLCFTRLHQLVGTEVDTGALTDSLGLVGADAGVRLARCVDKLARVRALINAGEQILLSPGIRVLLEPELDLGGDLVRDLHEAHLAKARSRRSLPEPPSGRRSAGNLGEREG